MPLTKEQLIERLKGAGIQFTVHEHAAVMTVDAQVFAKILHNALFAIGPDGWQLP